MKSNVVVVSINYRLGGLGFLNFGNRHVSGNQVRGDNLYFLNIDQPGVVGPGARHRVGEGEHRWVRRRRRQGDHLWGERWRNERPRSGEQNVIL